ncbi:MAG TPA: tRNA (N(6)-L-threonylcarbamoyladenosine(37)-C(2))-methylthiotransferase MtaB [Candidatus Latescibacteria bacterium]|nr:tRNA (N(6)-L-threonylcarbamoyladenosine(37)-C(2))-methylthiotransferase MtaB [Candidatus Latescibacterota bacterium]HJP32739.1 tRNA (N(6)-L-threonylcarbamoyladenosine(37)-C(2))-methylthiotransferase MtaB [Candidatus Latescibacterota bacterium]
MTTATNSLDALADAPLRESATPLRVAVQHLGCKLNQYEAEALCVGFQGRGYQVVPFDQDADVYVVNTCTVTGSGDADSRRAVRRARRRQPDAIVVATGCYAQRRPEELTDAGASLIVGNSAKAGLVDAVADGLAEGGAIDPARLAPGTDRPRTESFLQIDGAVDGGRTRGTLQIQDGCDEHCTYCIIPTVRGAGVSRPAEQILTQAQHMVDAGYRELALTGVHSGSYGFDLGDRDALVDLLRRLETIDGLDRIRLNSVEPGYITDDLIDYAAGSTHLCRHLHIPLQSGDDDILRRMGRRYTRAEYGDRVRQIAERIPGCALGADVMVGFPGESDGHHETTRVLLESLPLTYLHVFSYSLREGTPAQRLPDHVTGQTKTARGRDLIGLGQAKRLAFHRSHLGCEVQVLTEQIADGLATGLTDNYLRLRYEPGPDTAPNRYDTVRVTRAREDVLFGEWKAGP